MEPGPSSPPEMPDDVERALRSITQSPQLQPADEGVTGMQTSIDAANAGRYQTYNLVQNLEAEAPDRSPPPPSMTIPQWPPGSATNFRFEKGRRYHAYEGSSYPLPNDEQEINRLNLQHDIWAEILKNRLHFAPLNESTVDVLDLGCGTGIWLMQLSRKYPWMRLTGIDLSPIQPVPAPPNCTWVVADANTAWPPHFASAFDHIHTRTVNLGITDWDALLDRATASLRPGGWIELQESHLPFGSNDGTLDGTALQTWNEAMIRGAATQGVDLGAPRRFRQLLEARGYVNIKEVRLKAPIGPWAKGRTEKTVGYFVLTAIYDNLEGISLKLLAAAGLAEPEADRLVEETKKSLGSKKLHSWVPLIVVWAQKPPDTDMAEARAA